MKQNEELFEPAGKRRRNRLVGITVAVIGWGLMAVLLVLWLGGSSSADARTGTKHDTAKNSVSNVRAKVVTGSQRQASSSGALKLRLTARKDELPPRLSTNFTMARTASARPVKAGSGKVRARGRSKLVRIRLKPAALRILADCANPLVKVKVTVRGKSRTFRRKLRPDRSLCAVPKDVDLSRGRKCEFIDDPANPCLGTFPNDFFTRKDRTSGTGLRLNVDPEATPANRNRVHIGVDSLNSSDGFSPGASVALKIPGLDNQAAFDESGLVGEPDMSRAFDSGQSALLINAKTGQRHLIWTELDSKASSDADRTLIIRPGRNLTDGGRYIVALRNLRDADGKPIPAPPGFRLYRDTDRTSNRLVESRRAHFESIFRTLGKAGVDRGSLYLAWDFTVASTGNITGRMLSIRNRAFDLLGDHDLTDGSIAGTTAPDFEVTTVDDYSGQAPPYSGRGVQNIRTVTGTFQVPCYLQNSPVPADPCASGATFKLDAKGLPVRQDDAFYTARFTCNIPRSAVRQDGSNWVVDHQVRPSLYGHGLFGEYTEVNSTDIRQLGTENGVMVCGTDWIGMAEEDQFAAGVPALMDFTKFPALPDRLQQGFLDFLYLGRLMIHPDGLAANDAFRFGPAGAEQSVIDRSDLFYYGNSQGGIAGGALTAVATDITRSVLYVGAMNYSTLLPRSVDFDEFEIIMNPYYPNQMERPLIFSLIQTMWDRGEPNGYANHMTDDPLPDTPEHKVLMLMAYGDHQVANVATEVEARTIGARLRTPAVSRDRLAPGMVNPWFAHSRLGDLAGPSVDGSGLFVWDIGPKRVVPGLPPKLYGTDPPPLANVPPTTSDSNGDGSDGYGIDPHDTVIRSSPLARRQIADFIRTDGKITNPCGANPCWAAGWQDTP